MQTHTTTQDRIRRTVNDLVMAEMFLIQATIESATIIGEGFNALGKQSSQNDDTGQVVRESMASLLQRLADEALEPYTSRFKFFRDMTHSES